MGDLFKYMIISVVLALGLGYFLGQAQESRDFKTRVQIVDAIDEDKVKFEAIKSYPNFEVKKSQDTLGRGNIEYQTASSTTAFFKIKAEGYKTKYYIAFLKSDKVKQIKMKRAKDYEEVMEKRKEEKLKLEKKELLPPEVQEEKELREKQQNNATPENEEQKTNKEEVIEENTEGVNEEQEKTPEEMPKVELVPQL